MSTIIDSKEAARHLQEIEENENSAATAPTAPRASCDDYDDFYIYGDENEDRIRSRTPSINLNDDFDEKGELIDAECDKETAVRTLLKSALDDDINNHDKAVDKVDRSDSKSDSEFVEIVTERPIIACDFEKHDVRKLISLGHHASSDSWIQQNSDFNFISKLYYDEVVIFEVSNVECVYSLDNHVTLATSPREMKHLYGRETGRLILTTYRLLFVADNSEPYPNKEKLLELDTRLQLFNCSKLPHSVVISLTSIFEFRACKLYTKYHILMH
jgi:hypothetical protein